MTGAAHDDRREADMPRTRTARVRRFLDARFRSPTAIYGLIVFTAFIAIASDGTDEEGRLVSAPEMIGEAVPALLLFYIAHVFAHTLTDHGEMGFGPALRHALHHSSGMLYATLPTIAVLVVGSFTDMPGYDVYDWSMWSAVIVLGALGYAAYSERGSHVIVRLLGAVGTALLGALIILLEYVLH